ncbi:MAG: PAS domain S-box protein, partial [Anaerolineae bacterium]
IGVVFVDTDLMVQFFTPAATRVIHLIDSDIGRPLSHIASNLLYDDLITDTKRLLRTLSPREFEAQSEDGRLYLVRLRPYRTAEYAIGGAVITFTDITHHMTADMRRLQLVMRTTLDAITILDRHGRILAWNRGAEEMYGYAETDALQMNIRDIVPEERREMVLAQIQQIFAGETIESFETLRLAQDGSRLDVWLTVTALTDEQGRVTAVATNERDVTERKQMEADLRASAEHNQMVLRAALNGFWLLDAAGTILETNDAYCQMTGYSRDEILGKHITDFEAAETPEETADRIQKVIATGGDHFETQHKCKDGRIIDLSISVSYMDVEGGRFVGFMRDITERKQTEEQIKRHAALLQEVADAIIATDQNFIIKSWNRAAEMIYGWREDEVIGQQVGVLTRQEYIHEKREDVIQQFMEQGVWRGEVFQYHKNGDKLRIQAAVTLIKDEDGNPVGVVAVNRPAPRGEYHDQKARQTQ